MTPALETSLLVLIDALTKLIEDVRLAMKNSK